MIGNLRLRSGVRRLAHGRRLPLAAGLIGLVLATVFGAGAAAAIGRHHPATPAVSSSVSSDIKHDEAFVASKYHHCAAFSAAHKCPFQAAATGNGAGGHLIAIDLRQTTGDDCLLGIVYFFDGTRFVGTSHLVRPHSPGGVEGVRAIGVERFSVTYGVNDSKSTICARTGDAGTDVYKYRWNGTGFVKISGRLPRLPKVIVGL